MQIRTMDAMFSMLDNPLEFLIVNIIFKRGILIGLAIISWLIPLSEIFAPGALTGES